MKQFQNGHVIVLKPEMLDVHLANTFLCKWGNGKISITFRSLLVQRVSFVITFSDTIIAKLRSDFCDFLCIFLGVQDVTDTSFWPNESKRLEDKVSTDRLFLETRGILDDYNKTGLNPGFVVERVNIYYNRSETDQGWEFFFKGYEDLFVRIRRHENEHWISFQRDFLLQSKSKTETYKSFGCCS